MCLWVRANVPGGQFAELSCDFGGEYAQQGHGGDNVLIPALRTWVDAHPGFRVRPLPPHSQSWNLAENAIHQLGGLAFANGIRAKLGPKAWSILLRGAEHQHNMRAAHRANDPDRHGLSRYEHLLGRPLDASCTIGFNGQVCWAQKEGAKANTFQDVSRPGLYVRPAFEARGHEFFDLGANKLTVERGLAFSDRNDAPLTLAFSDIFKSRGAAGSPSPDEYTARLRSMLVRSTSSWWRTTPSAGLPKLSTAFSRTSMPRATSS